MTKVPSLKYYQEQKRLERVKAWREREEMRRAFWDRVEAAGGKEAWFRGVYAPERLRKLDKRTDATIRRQIERIAVVK